MRSEHDVFISYAHIDNEPLPLSEEGWISFFDQCLRVFLRQYLGRDISVWRDPRLESNSIFADEILDNLRKARVLVAVLSPRYIKSEWCLRELQQFKDLIQQDQLDRIGNISRIFKVEKLPIDAYPSELDFLSEQLACRFFEIDSSTGNLKELRVEFGEEVKNLFLLKVSDLAQEIKNLLQEFDHLSTTEQLDITAQPSSISPDDRPPDPQKTVYLASATTELEDIWNNIKRELTAQGYCVLPKQPLSSDVATLAKQVKGDLKQCTCSIHLFGQKYGYVPEGSVHSNAALQNMLAMEHSKTHKLSRIVWLPKGLTPKNTEKRQRELIEKIKQDPDILSGADVLQGSVEELKHVVLNKLQQTDSQKVREIQSSDKHCCVYLDFDRQDLANPETKAEIQEIYTTLKQQCKTVYIPDKGENIISFVDERLKQCDGVIIYFGHGDQNWLSSRWKATSKAMGYGGAGGRTKARSIYMGHPMTPAKGSLKNKDVPLIYGGDGFSPTLLQPFFEQLQSLANANTVQTNTIQSA